MGAPNEDGAGNRSGQSSELETNTLAGRWDGPMERGCVGIGWNANFDQNAMANRARAGSRWHVAKK